MIKDFIKLVRLKHYIKNIFIFMPLFFFGGIQDIELLLKACIAFVSFCLIASSVYILNDINDAEDDRTHPTKKDRPIASGRVSVKIATILFVALCVSSVVTASLVSSSIVVLVLIYFGFNVAYTFSLKTIPIIDISIIAIGFVLRLFVGSNAVSVDLSHWIVAMTFLLALFLAASKRRDDALIYQKTGKKMRKVIDGYNIKFLDSTISMLGSIVIVAYLMYSTSVEVINKLGNEYVYLTSIFVIIGVLKYMHSIFVDENSGSPTLIVLTDRALQIVILAWLASFAWIIYS